jgi:eukaryotic-like serine/threonine-protein kinase
VRWPLDLFELYITAALWYLGDTAELVRVLPLYLRDAQDRGDKLVERGLRSWRGNAVWLVLDRPDEALAHVDAVTAPRGPGQAFQLRHFYELTSRVQIELYRGDAAAAYALVREHWRALEKSLVMRVQTVRMDGWFARGRCALAVAAAGGDAALLAEAETMAAHIEGEAMAWGLPLAALLRATVAHRRGDAALARGDLEAALAGFVERDMALFAAVARRRLGELTGDAATIAVADAAMRAGRVVRPDAIVGMLAPGW